MEENDDGRKRELAGRQLVSAGQIAACYRVGLGKSYPQYFLEACEAESEVCEETVGGDYLQVWCP